MGISASNMNISSSNIFRSIATPAPNRTAIIYGAVRTPTPSALATSNTAYATNANPATGGPTFTSSAQVLAQNAVTTSNAVPTRTSIESGSQLQQALSQIAEQTPAPRFQPQGGPFSTQKVQQPQTQQVSNTRQFSPVDIFSNARVSTPAIESGMALTGLNAGINATDAANIAAVNARFGVNFSQEGSQALQGLQNVAAQNAMANNITTRMDGMIPLAPTLVNDVSLMQPAGTRGSRDLKIFDNLTETFNKMMDGGGHGGGGGYLGGSPKRDETAQETQPRKGLNFLG